MLLVLYLWLRPLAESERRHVFVIDDNEDSRRLLEQALEYCGVLVTLFSSAEAALEREEYLPTLIVSDISMPGMTGLEFTPPPSRREPAEKGA